MPKIFISYRRDDSLDVTGRIYDRMATHFGKEEVFRDVDTIPPGADFRAHITDAVAQCDVLLAIIGPNWLSQSDSKDDRRIDQEEDYVRIEIESGLELDVLVVPVLVRWAEMPKEEELPCSLRDLVFRNAAQVRSDQDFHSNLDKLIQDLERHLGLEAKQVSKEQPEEIAIVPKGLRSFDEDDTDFFLNLLPGPRDRNGFPDSLRFWKTRIEETDPDKTFTVGLIYGPSGCGKSSLVRAGLLPSLAKSVTTIYLEAAADDTESRLRTQLAKEFPVLADHTDLVEMTGALAGIVDPEKSEKVVLVIDQFEQWLHVHEQDEAYELQRALSHCDGRRLQCIIMVRDDFWMGVSRFFDGLGVAILVRQNSLAVDLFEPLHARKVLTRFGQAFGRLPTKQKLNNEQTQFLTATIDELSQGGRVIPVQLVVFAEMVKGKAWLRRTLEDLGGADGVGVAFLEETFCSSTAPPPHRRHQKAARRLLSALLPNAASGIKGRLESRETLLVACGYEGRPGDFNELLRILDTELRLITPTEVEQLPDKTEQSNVMRYQLTHDYLVPSLRQWLTHKQRETRSGRADILLQERTEMWQTRGDSQSLPNLGEWFEIIRFSNRRQWDETHTAMLNSATLKHLVVLVSIALVALTPVLYALSAYWFWRYNQSVAVVIFRAIGPGLYIAFVCGVAVTALGAIGHHCVAKYRARKNTRVL